MQALWITSKDTSLIVDQAGVVKNPVQDLDRRDCSALLLIVKREDS